MENSNSQTNNNFTQLEDGFRTTCISIPDSGEYWWQLKFDIGHYLENVTSLLEVRLHMPTDKCARFDVYQRQGESATLCDSSGAKYLKCGSQGYTEVGHTTFSLDL